MTRFRDIKQHGTSAAPIEPEAASSLWTITAVTDPKGGVKRSEFRRSQGYVIKRKEYGMVVSHNDHAVIIPWGNVACIVRDCHG